MKMTIVYSSINSSGMGPLDGNFGNVNPHIFGETAWWEKMDQVPFSTSEFQKIPTSGKLSDSC
jgi:hypothetical protein